MLIACGMTASDCDDVSTGAGQPVLRMADLADALRHLRLATDDVLLVLGPELHAHETLRYTARARAARPEAVLVLVHPGLNRQERLAAQQAGIDAVLPAGDLIAVGRACRDFLLARADDAPGRMVTVFAAKGGCGKTTIAVNLALALAEDPARRVALVDLDLRFGDVAATLGLAPPASIIAGPGEWAGPTEVVTPLGRRLDCMLAPVGPGEAERLESDEVDVLLGVLMRRYDLVVVDTPGGFTRPVLSALDLSDHHLLVTTPERPALQSLRRTLDTIDLLGHPRDSRHVIFNRSDSGVGITAGDVEQMLRAPIAAHVPSSRDVPASVNRCTPLMVSSPGHPVSSAIRRFAQTRLVSPAPASPAVTGGAMT
jgi:MinD-like ATPase involved in chromosome partitioning or flagellar assembly